ncbi:MAG TPA: arginase family protein [Rhodocyclaceae bacterium]|nr:arginase family protein [Rhodocyclaceae bacterium]
MATPLVLDLDGSLAGLHEAQRLPLAEWQESVRFGCGLGVWRAFEAAVAARMPADYGTVFLGSGDFHHLSHFLLKRLPHPGPFDVVVFDNHPDNMRFPFGIHCGSWVRHAAALPGIRTIHVVGICSGDVGLAHAWENHLLPLYRGRVRYWTIGVDTGWARAVGLGKSVRRFDTGDALIDAFTAHQGREDIPVYLSIDKDVLSPDVARTNWDQGELNLEQVGQVIESLAGRLVGSDITGEISIHRYRTAWKRWLSALDDQPAVPEDTLAAWQAQQMAANRRLLPWIEAAYRR